MDAGRISRKAPAGDGVAEIRVISHRELLSELSTRRVFSAEQVAQIAAAASSPQTWLARPAPSTIGAHIDMEFAALQAAVEPARRGSGHVARGRAASATPGRRSVTSHPRQPVARSRKPRRSSSPRLFALVLPFAGLWVGWQILDKLAGY